MPPCEVGAVADGERDDRRPEPGPLRLPADDVHAGDPRWAWAVAVAVMVLALALYAFTRSPGTPQRRLPPPPTWNSLTLDRIAKTQALALGDSHPKSAVWVGARRSDVLLLLTGATADSVESDYVIEVNGRFRAAAPAAGADWLPGSLPSGTHLILVVRAFDGTVNARLITGEPGPDLARLGPLQSLRLGWF